MIRQQSLLRRLGVFNYRNAILVDDETAIHSHLLLIPLPCHLGCPDQFRVYRRSHMFNGEARKNTTTLAGCQQHCLATRRCLGIDWITRATATDAVRCFVVFPESTQLGLSPFPLDISDHYRRTFCQQVNMTSVGQNTHMYAI